MNTAEWDVAVQAFTERVLTWRKRRRLRKKERQKRKSVLRDWTEAILSAVVIVLLINQYLLQAYMIPSPSMVPTLEIRDRIFVNKLVYGPELVPGLAKTNGFRRPTRGEVIIFESPDYVSRGPVVDIVQRVVYMVTLSLVDIDKDELGQPKHHFLIKRAVGMPGDRLRFTEGEIEVLRRGETVWVNEETLRADMGAAYPTVRLYEPGDYTGFRALGVSVGQRKESLPTPNAGAISGRMDDYYANGWAARTQHEINPASRVNRDTWRSYEGGIRVGMDELLPLGDNRDNSRDGRYFGPVKLRKVLGRGLFKYWPLYRIGGIR